METITSKIEDLKAANISAWLEIEITTIKSSTDINALLDELLRDSKLELLKTKNRTLLDKTLTPVNESETLETMNDADVFIRCLDAYEIEDEDRALLKETYREAIALLQNADPNDK